MTIDVDEMHDELVLAAVVVVELGEEAAEHAGCWPRTCRISSGSLEVYSGEEVHLPVGDHRACAGARQSTGRQLP